MKTASIRNCLAVCLVILVLSALIPLSFMLAVDSPQIKSVEDFYDDSVWFQPDWADANKDADGLVFTPHIEDGAGQNGDCHGVVRKSFRRK
jgi:hypothetical protein